MLLGGEAGLRCGEMMALEWSDLRHAFCSHLAMRGAPARAIQELAGHKDLSMTQRYMHLGPAALDAAIRLLEQPNGPSQRRGSLQDFGDGH